MRLALSLILFCLAWILPAQAQVLYTGKADPNARATVPANSVGVDNAFYFDQWSGYVYGPKTLGQWNAVPLSVIIGANHIPVSSGRIIDISYAGWPGPVNGVAQVGALQTNVITAIANQPLSGTTTPGQSNSQTYNNFRVQTNVYGPDPLGNWLGYKGSELKGMSVIMSVQSPITTTTDNHKGDLVAGTFAATSSYDMEDQTLYTMSNATNCNGPSTPYPSASYPAGQNCWTRQSVHLENDNNNDAAIPWASWPGTQAATPAISNVVYTGVNASYNNLPTLTYTLTNPLPTRMIRDYTNSPYDPVTTLGLRQYIVVNLATTSGDLTMPNPHDPFGHDLITYPPIANPNYNPIYRKSDSLQNRWVTLYISPDGKTLITQGPAPLGVNGYGTLDFFWLGHTRTRYGLNMIAQGDTNAGREAAVNIQGGWWYGLLFDPAKIDGVPSAATDVNGALIASDAKSTIGNILYFPCNNTTNIANIGGFTLTGVDWCKAVPTRASTTMTLGTSILYGASAAAPTSITGYPSVFTALTPISEGATFEAPGVGNCPASVDGLCQIRYRGTDPYDIPWFGVAGSTPTNYCNGGTLLYGSRTAGVGTDIRLTTDGAAASSTNTLNLRANFQSQSGTINIDLQEQGGNHSQAWAVSGFFQTRKGAGVDTLTPNPIVPTSFDPDTLGSTIAITADGTNHGINITVSPAASFVLATSATACVRMAHAQ